MVDAAIQNGDLTRPMIGSIKCEYEFYCHVCQEEGRHLEAEGFCQNCRDYLCKTCFDSHCRPRPSRHHILLSKQDMPKDTSLLSQSKLRKDKCTEKCHVHQEGFMQYYCQDDDTLGCHVCAINNHRNCTKLLYIPDVCGGICDSRELKELLNDLNYTKDRTTAIIDVSKDNRSDIKKYYRDVMKSIQEFRKQINFTLDKLENDIKAKADKLTSEDEQKMKTISDNSNTTLKNIEAMTKSLEMLQSSKQECNLFVAMKKVKARIVSLLMSLDQTEHGNNVRKYKFHPGTELQKILKGKDVYGEISVIDDTDIQTAKPVAKIATRVSTPGTQGTVKTKPVSTRHELALNTVDGNKDTSSVVQSITATSTPNIHDNLKIKHMADINVKSKTDISKCDLTDAVALHEHKVSMTDYNNCKVKVIDTTSHQIVSEVKLSGQPWGITSISNREILKGKDAYEEISVMDNTNTQIAPSVTTTSTRVQTAGAPGQVKVNHFTARQAEAVNPMTRNLYRTSVVPSLIPGSSLNKPTSLQIRHWNIKSKTDKTDCDVNGADINVKSKTDKNSCNISGAVALRNNKVIITDYDNDKVKVVDITAHQIVSEVQLSGEPWDITSISSREFAVTLPWKYHIVFLNLREDSILSIERRLSVNGCCNGIVCRKGQLVVSYTRPVKVEILSLNGDVQHTIHTDSTGFRLFNWPHYLAISPDQNTIYVSDCDKHTVTSLSATGFVKAIYNDDQLKRPTGLITDTGGRVYVCCENNRAIHVLTAECEKIKILHTKDTGLDSNPWALCYCEMTKKLFVGTESNTIKLYQIE